MTSEPHHRVIPQLATRGHIAVTRDALMTWGEQLGAAARPPLVIGISGELGVGKTTLVQAICFGAGVREPVTSPTFAIVHRYRGAGATAVVYHLDLYRIEGPHQVANLGWDEIVSAHALVLVEWPEHAGAAFPPNAARIDLEYDAADPNRRLLLAG
ncbi:MAG TPA: tRNA (adenosine(37)-N6)-threonylcarbamoyltransferase complex ATPase subunit type 1 TsaE [Gemmatimonadaceae bacterium]|jgi:tRNA threonylcarbamoyladenosine biosynthesis protein TsaE